MITLLVVGFICFILGGRSKYRQVKLCKEAKSLQDKVEALDKNELLCNLADEADALLDRAVMHTVAYYLLGITGIILICFAFDWTAGIVAASFFAGVVGGVMWLVCRRY